jgi:biotin carboxyl carrier protein
MQTKDSDEKKEFKTLDINETKYQTLFTTKFENRKAWEKADERKILAYLPGTAVKVNVKKGDKVKAGQLLLVFEAMKMMNTVKATKDGIIKEVYAIPGEAFPKNFVVLEME